MTEDLTFSEYCNGFTFTLVNLTFLISYAPDEIQLYGICYNVR
jgi:hypothetical protein